MKTNLTQIGRPGVVAAIAVVLSLLGFPLSEASAPSYAGVESIVVRLPPGVTGDAVQRALDALPDCGGEVVLPPGEIVIRQPVVLRRDAQILRGSGPATVLWLADDANCPVIIMGEPVNSPKQTVKNLRVGDFAINGNRSNQQRELWKLAGEGSEIRNNGITVQGVTDSVIENVTSARCRSGGLVTTRNVRRLTVRGLDAFDNQFDGLACYQTEDCLFTDLYLHDNPGAGISLDLAFNHNVISNAVLNANDLGVFMRASRNNQFCNVTGYSWRTPRRRPRTAGARRRRPNAPRIPSPTSAPSIAAGPPSGSITTPARTTSSFAPRSTAIARADCRWRSRIW